MELSGRLCAGELKDIDSKLTTTNLQRINISLGKGQSVSLETNPTTNTTNFIYHHTDHLTGSSVDTDQGGYLLEVQDYLPFGSQRVDQQFQSYKNKKKFTGKELDTESGLYYYGARYYESDIGRWAGVDPAVMMLTPQILLDVQTLNAYTYTRNNPLKYIDPTGMYKVDTGEIEKGDTEDSITRQVEEGLGIKTSWERIAEVSFFQQDYGTTKVSELIGQKTKVGTKNVKDISNIMKTFFDYIDNNLSQYQDCGIVCLENFTDWFGINSPFDLKAYNGTDPISIVFGNASNPRFSAYIYNGELIRRDEPGNILAGYGAAFIGIDRRIVHSAAYLAGTASNLHSYISHDFNSRYFSLGDDPVDTRYLEMGYCHYYKSPGCGSGSW